MGEVDIAVLHPIYRKCVELNKENNWNFQFKVDSGDYETMLEFVDIGIKKTQLVVHHPPKTINWETWNKDQSIPICPDIMDFTNKIVLEYEEESKVGKSSGKMGKKGHWSESKRDTRRDKCYKLTNFRFCKIWETELRNNIWKIKLFYFFADCYTKRNLDIYQYRFINADELFETRKKFLT